MSAFDRVRIIRTHLQAISRGGAPSADKVGVWIKELERIPLESLDEAMRQAREEHTERVDKGKSWGHITPDDVLGAHRRLGGGGSVDNAPPHNPMCSLRCTHGRVSLICPEGYDICVRCSCTAGDWWKQSPVYGRQHSARELLDMGYLHHRAQG